MSLTPYGNYPYITQPYGGPNRLQIAASVGDGVVQVTMAIGSYVVQLYAIPYGKVGMYMTGRVYLFEITVNLELWSEPSSSTLTDYIKNYERYGAEDQKRIAAHVARYEQDTDVATQAAISAALQDLAPGRLRESVRAATYIF